MAKKGNGKKTKSSRQDKKARQKEKIEAMVEFKEEIIEEKDEEETEEIPTEDDEKDVHLIDHGSHVEVVESGPTSFGELDAEEDAREQARKVRGVAFDTEMLVRNIMRSPMEAPEKETSLSNLAADFGTRLRSVMNKEVKELDLDEAEFIAFAKSIPEQGIVEKARLATFQVGNLKDEDFAIIEDKHDKGWARHYPIHNEKFVRNSLARASKAIKEGGDDAIIAHQAIDNIMIAAKKMGIGMPSKENGNGILIQKDNNGDWRWIGWVSNNFKDREGDIIVDKAHQEFVQFLDDNPEHAPRFWSWHTRETERKHRADWWDYQNGFLLMSGKLIEKEAQALLRVATKERLGMSHGFVALRDPQNAHLITFYRSFEASDLPLKHAANAFTDIDAILKQEVKTMSVDKNKYLTDLLGEEQAARIIKDTETAQAQLENAGVEKKETEDVKEEKGADDGDSPKEDAKGTPDLDALVAVISAKVADSLELAKLSDMLEKTVKQLGSLPVIAKAVDEMQKDSDEKLAGIIESPAAKKGFAWSAAESESEENVVKDKDPLKGVTKEGENWLSDLANAPVLDDADVQALSGGIQQR